MRTVYVIGYPGSGKSSAMARALMGLVARAHEGGPLAFVEYRKPGRAACCAVQLGRVRPGFAGTDALSLSVQPRAVAWIGRALVPLVVAEGDRLANDGFLGAAAEAGELVVALVDVAPELAAERATARALALGKPAQSASWWRGRCTKVDRLTERWAPVRLDGRRAPAELGAELREVMGL